jgi:phosphoribosylformimino-5-aminoimidazole carboxamide ribotide isomerase
VDSSRPARPPPVRYSQAKIRTLALHAGHSVIDLKDGVVVHARAGRRERYAPISSQLCAGSSPLGIVRALLDVHAFATLYVADLDAIEARGDHAAEIAAIARAFPGLALWVDCGLRDAQACRDWRQRDIATPVIGTEALADAAALRDFTRVLAPHSWVLSLDYRGERLLGGAVLQDTVAHWPARVIVMTLARVGSDAGPDLERIDEIRALGGGRKIYAAGGVRGGADLKVLAERGVSGALVATALHDGRLGRAGIAAATSGPASFRSDRS